MNLCVQIVSRTDRGVMEKRTLLADCSLFQNAFCESIGLP